MSSGRTVYIIPSKGGRGVRDSERGCKCCFGFCRIGTCDRRDFCGNRAGITKILEVVFAFICQFLLLKFGVTYANNLGFSYHLFLSTTSASFLTNAILIVCYLISKPSIARLKSSIFEFTFNVTLCCLYLGISSIFAKNVHQHLFYFYHTVPNFSAYPALTAVYVMGFIVGIIHGIDGLMSYKDYRRYR